MSRRSSAARPFCLGIPVAAMLCLPIAAAAEIVSKGAAPAGAKSRPPAVESMARVPADDASRSTLRCWQEGRLILESSGLSLVGRNEAMPTPMLRAEDGRTMQLLDLRHGLCVLEKSKG